VINLYLVDAVGAGDANDEKRGVRTKLALQFR
jgi:hypothetical protein